MGQVSQGEFNPVCFKCGTPGHISKTCKTKITSCSFPSCNSSTYNVEGHKVMVDLGRIVSPDHKASAASAGIPAVPAPKGKSVSAAEALVIAQAKQQKRWLKTKRKMIKEKPPILF